MLFFSYTYNTRLLSYYEQDAAASVKPVKPVKPPVKIFLEFSICNSDQYKFKIKIPKYGVIAVG